MLIREEECIHVYIHIWYIYMLIHIIQIWRLSVEYSVKTLVASSDIPKLLVKNLNQSPSSFYNSWNSLDSFQNKLYTPSSIQWCLDASEFVFFLSSAAAHRDEDFYSPSTVWCLSIGQTGCGLGESPRFNNRLLTESWGSARRKGGYVYT